MFLSLDFLWAFFPFPFVWLRLFACIRFCFLGFHSFVPGVDPFLQCRSAAFLCFFASCFLVCSVDSPFLLSDMHC